MQSKTRFIPQHTDGHFITIRCERTKDFVSAARFNHEEDLLTFLNGQFGPEHPEQYKVAHLKISYELEVSEDGIITGT